MRMGRRQYQKGEKTMTIQQHNTAARTDSQGAQTMTIHRERRRPIGSVSSTLRGVALAGMALFLVGCDSGGSNVLSPTPLPTAAPVAAPTAAATTTAIAAPTRIIELSGNLAFGIDTVGTSNTETLTITNTGNSRLSWTDISTGLAVVTASPTSGSVKPGGSKTVTLTFSPVDAITYSGKVTVTSNKTSGKNTIAVSGTGTTPAMKATPQATYEHAYYCPEPRDERDEEAGVTVTITEAGGNIGMTVTSMVVRLYHYSGTLEVDKTLSASEIASQWGGSNHLGPGVTRVIHYQSAFPGGKHPEDGDATVIVYITDDAGNTMTLEQHIVGRADRC